MKNYLLIVIILVGLVGCKDRNQSKANLAPIEVVKTEVNTSDLTAKLITHFIDNPTRQPEKDQNDIVTYAIDQGLNVERTASGLYYQILKEGNGISPKRASKITVHYEGRFLNGEVFDSSIEKKRPLSAKLYKMIRGWEEGLQLIKEGGKVILLIPSRLAYGEEGFEDRVAPHTPLVFEIDLLKVE